MTPLHRILILAVLGTAAGITHLSAQNPPERAIRRDIPLTNMIRHAHTAGTRDSTGRPGRNYWQAAVDYSIDARLDEATSTVSGRESVVIRNHGNQPLTTIVLRLDQNIFRPMADRLTGGSVLAPTEGMIVTRITIDGQNVELRSGPLRRGETLSAPTAVGLATTLAQVLLPTPIAAHATATLEVDWNFQVPGIEGGRGLRTGRMADSVYQIAQWYPRVAKFDDLRGWDTEPYLGPSEFYNNFGRFDVRIDVPAGWLVGATGTLQNSDKVLTPAARARLARVLESDTIVQVVRADELGPGKSTSPGQRLVWHFVADTVNDFAWATSRSYVWDATRATIPDKGAVPIHMFYLRNRAQDYERVGAVTRHALEFYSKLWLPYAFPQLTVVDGPELGMEYPMFIMSGLAAADHEVGHEWWPMTVGVNETWYGFMDEGFDVYMNALSTADARQRAPVLDTLGQSYGRISGDEREAPLMWNANYGGPMYRFQAYGKAPLMLSMLGGIVGDTAVWQAMSDYAKAWRFKHPTPWDFAFSMSNSLERDLGWFWYYWLFTTEAVHGSIQNVTTSGATTHVTVRQDGEMPSPVVLKVEFAPTGPAITPMPNSVMTDSTSAIVTYPVDVWFNGSRTFDAALNFGGRQIQKITLDPRFRFPDRDTKDNVWPR